MNITLTKYFIVITTSLLLLPLLFILSSTFVLSAADHVLISEVQVSGGVADDEFVELFNPTSSEVVMENWRLTRMTQTGTESNLVADIDGTIPAHGYFLIAPDEYDGTVVRDFAYSTSQRLAANNTVVLYSQSIVDESPVYTSVDTVGMGTATVVETTAVEVPSADGSIRRVNDEDSNNNANDFEVIEVSDPQNSTVVVSPTPTVTPTATPTSSPSPTSSPTASPTMTATPTVTPTATPNPTVSPTPTATASATPTSTPSPSPTSTPRSIARFFFPRMTCSMQVRYISFGFWRMPFAMMVCERV